MARYEGSSIVVKRSDLKPRPELDDRTLLAIAQRDAERWQTSRTRTTRRNRTR